MEKVDIYCRLVFNSKRHGQFLVDAFELDPNVKICRNFEFMNLADTVVMQATMNDDAAVIMKLKYSDCHPGEKMTRPTPEEKEQKELYDRIKDNLSKKIETKLWNSSNSNNRYHDFLYSRSIKESVLDKVKFYILKDR